MMTPEKVAEVLRIRDEARSAVEALIRNPAVELKVTAAISAAVSIIPELLDDHARLIELLVMRGACDVCSNSCNSGTGCRVGGKCYGERFTPIPRQEGKGRGGVTNFEAWRDGLTVDDMIDCITMVTERARLQHPQPDCIDCPVFDDPAIKCTASMGCKSTIDKWAIMEVHDNAKQ
jgi:hypothetical protein